jgi:hypothetical protein
VASFIELPWLPATGGTAIIVFDKVVGVTVQHEQNPDPGDITAVVFLDGGTQINLAGESARDFLKAFRERS